MRHRGSRLVLVLALVGGLVLVGTFGERADARRSTTIKLGDNFFKPKREKVRKGTRVRFKWVGRNPHNVTKTRGPGGDFASKTTDDRGVNFKRKFRKRGSYKLVCTIHEGMKLKLKVR